jgi:hypothetical protein
MCSICLHAECPSSCPNAPEPKIITLCAICGGNISEGEEYVQINPCDITTCELEKTICICNDCIYNQKIGGD